MDKKPNKPNKPVNKNGKKPEGPNIGVLTIILLALWDVIDSCDITGSSDASIRNAKPTDIKSLLKW